MKSFNNYLVAVENNSSWEFNFRFKFGDKSNLKSSELLKETKIHPEGAKIKRAVVWYNSENRYLTCIELFNKAGYKLLQAGAPLSER
jgi:hypothetical protein